ncbi:MAG: DUF4278 domain-containing protein [Pleurocapsa sp. MO_226.B13]|nr:DUF4278 domain-containing protein [Pleurocapsa sp. MO_226.B13]
MQLTYRGITYQASNLSLPNSSARTGKYRGQTVNINSTVRLSRKTLVAFKYRGVDYIQYTGDRYL